MPPLPKKLTILGHPIKVVLVSKLEDDNHGDCDHIKRTIRISTSYPLDQQWATLYHECTHMVLGLTGLSELLTDNLEEAVVVAIENGLYPLINHFP